MSTRKFGTATQFTSMSERRKLRYFHRRQPATVTMSIGPGITLEFSGAHQDEPITLHKTGNITICGHMDAISAWRFREAAKAMGDVASAMQKGIANEWHP